MTAVARARAAWGEPLPDWIKILALAADQSSQSAVAKRLGKSGAAVSQILANKYHADTGAIERVVRGVLMGVTVECPVAGEISIAVCSANQQQPFSTANRQSVRLHRACPQCPHFQYGGKDAQ